MNYIFGEGREPYRTMEGQNSKGEVEGHKKTSGEEVEEN